MVHNRYCLSFTSGSLLQMESINLALLNLELGDWNIVREKVISENLLQTRTVNSSKRICREVISRLETLNLGERGLLVVANSQEQKHLLWIAICRRYTFIADFAVEVLREHYLTLKSSLSYADFDAFFYGKSEWHEELNKISSETRKKLRQILFKILREVNLLDVNMMINAAMLTPRLLNTIYSTDSSDLNLFPAFESDLKRSLQ